MRRLLLGLTLCAFNSVHAQQPPFDFSIRNIMRGPELYGREPQNIRWTADGKWIYFTWLEAGSDWRLPTREFRVRAEPGARPERVTQAQLDSAVFAPTGRLSSDGKTRLMIVGGHVALVEVATRTERKLTDGAETESNPIYAADGSTILFVRGNNVFSIPAAGGTARQLTDIRLQLDSAARNAGGRGAGGGRGGAAQFPTDSSSRGQRASLERQQKELFQFFRDQAFRDSVARVDGRGAVGGGGRGRGGNGFGGRGGNGVTSNGSEVDIPGTKTIRLLPNERVGSITVSPTGRALLLATVSPGGQSRGTIVPSWVTTSGYVEEINGRAKVGDAPQGESRLLYVAMPSGESRVISTGGPSDLPNRTNVIGWNPKGTAALVVSSTSDNKNRYTYVVSDAGDSRLVETVHDSAWVGGPCGGCIDWYGDGRRFFFVNESDGWAHLYTMAADGSDRRQLTKGKWEVLSVTPSRDDRSFYIESSEPTPLERHFYKLSVNGGAREKISGPVGGHNITLSPDESMIANVFSTANRPPDLYIQANKPGAAMSQLTQSASAEFLSHDWIKAPIVMVPASDGQQVPTRIFKPQDVGAQPNGAAVIFVHGAGYLHNVMNYWTSSYPREWMFNQYLASKGYVVLDLDYRASAGWGRDWRTAIYRWMGGRDLQDQVDGVRYLQKNFNIDPERVGIYGGSYGGFMTLMALFTEPKWFGAGAALRSVTDWAHYNHGYTSAILNLPDKDTTAYRQSSPIFFAQGLEDPLIMLHGMVDTNVEFEDIVRLTQRLIELHKPNWSLTPYPVEDHSFVRPDSWTDEYTRIFNLFESTIRTGKKDLRPF
jgi:dipeptidyl aminopeptidase/acylaminoacyl peptidase